MTDFDDNFDSFDNEMGAPGPEIPSMESLGIPPIDELLNVEEVLRPPGTIEQASPDDGLVEDDEIYADTQIETITDGATTVTDTDKLTITAGAGITAVIAQDGVAEKGDAILTITNTDLGSDADDIYIGLVTNYDESVKVEPCDKIKFVGATVVDQNNGDALVTIDNDQGLTGTGTDLFAHEWVRVTAGNSGVKTIDEGDWRGRVIRGYIAYFRGTTANANLEDRWDHNGTGGSLVDVVSGATTIGCNSAANWANNIAYSKGNQRKDTVLSTSWICLVAHTSAVAGTFADDRAANPTYWTTYGAIELGDGYNNEHMSRLYIDCGDSGKLKYGAFNSYAQEYHARFWVQASEKNDAPGETVE